MFVRFVVGLDHEHHRRLSGLFTETRTLLDDDRLHAYQEEWLETIYAWFNRHLPCPPFASRPLPHDAVCWYRAGSTVFISRMWDLASILSEHGHPVRLLRSADPGRVVYEDEFQVAVRPWRAL